VASEHKTKSEIRAEFLSFVEHLAWEGPVSAGPSRRPSSGEVERPPSRTSEATARRFLGALPGEDSVSARLRTQRLAVLFDALVHAEQGSRATSDAA